MSGGQYNPVNNPLPEELKPVLIEMVKRGWTDVAADILLGYGVDFKYYQFYEMGVFGSDMAIMTWLLSTL